MDEPQKHYTTSDKANTKDRVVESHLYEVLRRGKFIDRKKFVVAWGWDLEQGLTEKRNDRIFWMMEMFKTWF